MSFHWFILGQKEETVSGSSTVQDKHLRCNVWLLPVGGVTPANMSEAWVDVDLTRGPSLLWDNHKITQSLLLVILMQISRGIYVFKSVLLWVMYIWDLQAYWRSVQLSWWIVSVTKTHNKFDLYIYICNWINYSLNALVRWKWRISYSYSFNGFIIYLFINTLDIWIQF